MAYENKCPVCGCYLDPCERCDCTEEVKRNENPAEIRAGGSDIGVVCSGNADGLRSGRSRAAGTLAYCI